MTLAGKGREARLVTQVRRARRGLLARWGHLDWKEKPEMSDLQEIWDQLAEVAKKDHLAPMDQLALQERRDLRDQLG